MGRFVEELTGAGCCWPPAAWAAARTSWPPAGTSRSPTGRFTESKEQIVSFALFEVRSQEEALELSRRFWKIVEDGEGDIRQVFGPEG
jgi:hypothetical protein